VTADIGSLAPSGVKASKWRDTAVIGGPWENDGSMAFGFLKLAD